MANQHLEPGEVQAWLDGEAAPQEHARLEAHLRSCQDCRDAVSRAAWEVGLIHIAGTEEGAAAPSPGFEDRVLERIRATPREAAPPLRALPPVPRPASLSTRLRWIAAAASLLAAASAGLWFARDTGRSPDDMPTGGQGGAVANARSGGVLRWSGATFDRSLAGSAWIEMDAAVPTYAGEILHSPAPSSIHVRLPGGGRLTAGSSSWLSVGSDGEFALLEGALTASADPSGRLVVEVPGAVVTATGEVEVSARTPSGAKSAEGARWLGSWAAARAKDAAPGTPEAPAPAAALVVYARRGPVEFAASPGPVRNSLERTIIPEGQALVVLEKKVYRVAASLEEAMPEQTGWLEGMPVPPDSKFFRGGAPAGTGPAPAPPPHFGTGGGPVRNSLERALADREREAERRAYALSVYDSVGGAEAITAAASVVDDPAVLVRSAAVRILALNAWADRERAFVALRRLARDPDAGVARFAILAIKTLGDRGAIPDLKTLVVDDDAPPDSPSVTPDGREYRGPRTVAQVYAFDALVSFGDVSALPKAAELVPKVAGDRTLAAALQNAIKIAVKKLDHAEIRGLLSSEIPGIRAAAIRALGDASEARKVLNDPSEAIRLAAAEVLLIAPGAEGLGDWQIPVEGSRAYRTALLNTLGSSLKSRPEQIAPAWAVRFARSMLSDSNVLYATAINCMVVLRGTDEIPSLLSEGAQLSDTVLAALLDVTTAPLPLVERGLNSDLPHLRWSALQRLSSLSYRPESEVPTARLLEVARAFRPLDENEHLYSAQSLAALMRARDSHQAFESLLERSASGVPEARRGAAFMLFGQFDRSEVCELAVRALGDSDPRIAVAAARGILGAAHDPSRPWTGPELASVVRETSPHACAEGLLALAAWRLGTSGAEERFLSALVAGGTSDRRDLFSSLDFAGLSLSRVDPTLSNDSSPRTRMQLLTATRDPLRSEIAQSLRDDPYEWVRATALACLASSGDATADADLRSIVREGRLGCGVGPSGLVGPDRPDIGPAVLAMSRFAASVEPSLDSVLASGTGIQDELNVTIRRARAMRLSRAIATPTHPVGRIQFIRSTMNFGDSSTVGALVQRSSQKAETNELIRAASAETATEFIGFAPTEGLRTFYAEHAVGILTSGEVAGRIPTR